MKPQLSIVLSHLPELRHYRRDENADTAHAPQIAADQDKICAHLLQSAPSAYYLPTLTWPCSPPGPPQPGAPIVVQSLRNRPRYREDSYDGISSAGGALRDDALQSLGA